MKTRHLITALALTVASTSLHAADSYWRYGLSQNHHNGSDGNFVVPNSGAYVKNVTLDKGTQLNLAVGTGVGERLRIEAELSQSFANQVGSNGNLVSPVATSPVTLEGDVERTALMANVIMDLGDTMQAGLTPYALLGVGMSQNKLSNLTLSAGTDHIAFEDSGTMELAWKVGLGATWRTSNNVLVDIGANYFNAGDVESDKTVFSSALASNSELVKPFTFEVAGMNYGISVRVPF